MTKNECKDLIMKLDVGYKITDGNVLMTVMKVDDRTPSMTIYTVERRTRWGHKLLHMYRDNDFKRFLTRDGFTPYIKEHFTEDLFNVN